MKTEAVIFDTITPHPGPVSIAELLADIEGIIKRHVILSDHAAAALAVWVLHTYTFELRDTVAYVAIESPEKRCGKTTLLSVLAAMACKSLIASNITVGALFRAIHTCTPTLFIDEADTFLAGNSIMRGIINSGNTRRTAYVLRLSTARGTGKRLESGCAGARPYHVTGNAVDGTAPLMANEEVEIRALASPENGTVTERRLVSTLAPPDGCAAAQPYHVAGSSFDGSESTDSGLKKYSCWCPKVIAMIGQVPDTIADRSIVVKMARKLTTETCAPLAALDTAHIRARCARFALDARDAIEQHPKMSGDGLNDRATDTFDPLFVIARLAGDEWEQKLRAAALGLCSAVDVESSGSGLILDIVDLFVECGTEKLFSRDIVTRLRDGGMKSQTLQYSSLNEHQIARVLRPYGVKPSAMRMGKEVRNGYMASDFREAMKRYVSGEDIQKHVEELRRRCDLKIEARAEAARERALMEKVIAAIPKGKFLTQNEILDLTFKMKREEEANSEARSQEPEGGVRASSELKMQN